MIKQPSVAVGAIVFKQERILLVKRGKPPALDEWAIPGGKVQLGETLQQAAEREILEETGVHIKATLPCYSFDLIERDSQGNIVFHYVIIDLRAEYLDGEPSAGDDAQEAAWLSARELSSLKLNKYTEKLLRQELNFLIDQ